MLGRIAGSGGAEIEYREQTFQDSDPAHLGNLSAVSNNLSSAVISRTRNRRAIVLVQLDCTVCSGSV